MTDLNQVVAEAAAQPVDGKMISRERPVPTPQRAALVQQWLKDVAAARAHWEPDFKRMRRNMEFANGKQWPGQRDDDDRFMVNLVQRVIKSTVSSLYAKNPTVVATRRQKLDFQIWDGRPETAQQAQAIVQGAAEGLVAQNETGMALVQQAQALLADIQQGIERRTMLDKIGKTLVICTKYYLDEALPGFKLQMKQMMRRARTTGVGYVELGYQREMDLSEGQTSRIADMAERLAVIGQLRADLADGVTDPYAAEAETLALATATIQKQPEMIIREGLVFDFPKSTRIIPSISTERLMGWVGSEWVAKEILLSPARIKQVYGVDIGRNFTAYRAVESSPQSGETRRIVDRKNGLACVFHVYDKTTGMQMVLCEGYPDFLREPGAPDIFIEQFFPFFAVTFNDAEDEGKLFPKSDVELMMHPQKEYNRSKEALRQHRYANRPLYLMPKGAIDEEEAKSMQGYAAHSVIELNQFEKGRPATDMLAPVQKIGIDPGIYETASLFEDIQRVTGNAEANLGGTGNSTATESSIAEGSRQGSLGLDADDLDDMLTSLLRAAGTVLMTELDEKTVKEIAGPGAVWPTLSRADVAKEMWLEVKAGSSGRPNASRDAATFERVYPLLLQVPGISPRWLAERAVRIADDEANFEDAIIDGVPSIMAQNAMAQPGTGDPATDPNAQGSEGGDNKPAAPTPGGTAQPGFPGAGAGGTAVN